MIKTTLQRGFTLIELLVVIAIIGILAAVVIGSLNDARSTGQDASIKQSMANVRQQAELVYNSNGYSYNASATDSVCASDRVTELINASLSVVNGTGINAAPASNGDTQAARSASCVNSDTAWAAASPLTGGTGFWCVDSTGASREVAAFAAADVTAIACPDA